FLLVQLHEANRDWAQAWQRLSALLAVPQGETPDRLAHAIRLLLKQQVVKEVPESAARTTGLLGSALGQGPVLVTATLCPAETTIDPIHSLLTELRQQEPNTFRSVLLEAAVHHAAGDRAAALALLQTFARRPDADLGLVAAALEELGLTE